ncbi:MAG: DUF5522 domain-containing protein [Cyclobacteriaceae bacterium]|jgi:hypothetical protein|nr:DUF5522 domain-containing protein [Cyclobacteriaceae bacterium]
MTNQTSFGTKPLTLVENEDYYIEHGLMVFTEAYHRKRGFCCKSECRHCPYGYKKPRRR